MRMKPGKFQTVLIAGMAVAMTALAQETAPATNEPETAVLAPVAIPQPAPDPLSSAAAVYATYQSDVSDIEQHKFENVEGIQEALTDLGSQNAEQLSRGWIAYSALVASQSPEFRAAVRDVEGYYGRDFLVRGLQTDSRYARKINGGTTAVGAALNAGAADAQRLQSTAEYVKEQAYSLQAFGWAKGKLGDSGALATRLRADSMIGRTARPNMTTALDAPDIGSVLSTAGRSGAPSVWNSVSGSADRLQVVNVSNITSSNSPQPVRRTTSCRKSVSSSVLSANAR